MGQKSICDPEIPQLSSTLDQALRPKLRMSTYNTRRLRNSLEDVLIMYEKLDKLTPTETWTETSEMYLMEIVNEYVLTPGEEEKRGNCGVVMLINPIPGYEKVSETSSKAIQSLPVKGETPGSNDNECLFIAEFKRKRKFCVSFGN